LRHCSISRDVTRPNIPTAETRGPLRQEEENANPGCIRATRTSIPNRSDDEQYTAPLSVDTVPIYIQEKVKPEALICDLRRQAGGCDPQAICSRDFDRIEDPKMRLDFCQHAENWSNRDNPGGFAVGDELAGGEATGVSDLT
jgi:adenine-specific DNA-methyltransferase